MEFKSKEYNHRENSQSKVDFFNQIYQEPKGFECPKCKNKGTIQKLNDKIEIVSYDCECKYIRKFIFEANRLGLTEAMDTCTFDKFTTKEPWQGAIYKAAMEFVELSLQVVSPAVLVNTPWFYIGGQPGCGKTHICTAILCELMKLKRCSTEYLTWKDRGTTLKANTNTPEHSDMCRPYKTAKLLYIDDFWKTSAKGDINLAFEILDYRYKNKLTTIISSELTTDKLIDTDEAVASRIIERSKKFCFNVEANSQRNYRLN